MEIRVVAFDIYGTVIASDDYDNKFSPRKGLYEFVSKCREQGMSIVTASDESLDTQKRDLRETFRHRKETFGEDCNLDLFDRYFQMVEYYKEFDRIANEYGIKAEELFVFGDNRKKDILGAEMAGCPSFQVPQYKIFAPSYNGVGNYSVFLPPDTFSFMEHLREYKTLDGELAFPGHLNA